MNVFWKTAFLQFANLRGGEAGFTPGNPRLCCQPGIAVSLSWPGTWLSKQQHSHIPTTQLDEHGIANVPFLVTSSLILIRKSNVQS